MNHISIFNLTSKEFVARIIDYIGKGRVHAQEYYRNFFKNGDGLKGFNDKERQARSLFDKIHESVFLPDSKIKKQLVSQYVEKYVLEFHDKHIAELVVIPMKTGLTLCVSSQVGCKMACAFCETGRMGKLRDLSTEEIVAQVYFAKHTLHKDIKNIVFMGMGEPFDNFDNVLKAIDVLTDPIGFNFAPSRITVSTSGVVPKILEFIPYGTKGVKLAVSVNGSNNQNRTLVMPINRRYNMETLLGALQTFTTATQSQILAEYVMMEGVNDSLECAEQLSVYLKDLPCIINLIPYNSQSLDHFRPPEEAQIKRFQHHLKEKSFKVYVRKNKGDKIMAACGQLGELNLKKSLSQKEHSF